MDKRDDIVTPMQYGLTCVPFNYSIPEDNTYWAGAGYIDDGGSKNGEFDCKSDIVVETDPGHVKLFGHIGKQTHYKYSFRVQGIYIPIFKKGELVLEARRSTGKGLGTQFRVKLWNRHGDEIATYWLSPNVQCVAEVDFDPAAEIHELGVDSRDFNGNKKEWWLTKPYR